MATPTFSVIFCNIAVLVQYFLHTAKGDGSQVPWVFQLQKTLQVHSSLATPEIDTLAIFSIQPTNPQKQPKKEYFKSQFSRYITIKYTLVCF